MDGECPKLNDMLLKCLELNGNKKICIHDPAILCNGDEKCPSQSKCVDLLPKSYYGICVPLPHKLGNFLRSLELYNTTQVKCTLKHIFVTKDLSKLMLFFRCSHMQKTVL